MPLVVALLLVVVVLLPLQWLRGLVLVPVVQCEFLHACTRMCYYVYNPPLLV